MLWKSSQSLFIIVWKAQSSSRTFLKFDADMDGFVAKKALLRSHLEVTVREEIQFTL
jgi:hypothetical protein